MMMIIMNNRMIVIGSTLADDGGKWCKTDRLFKENLVGLC